MTTRIELESKYVTPIVGDGAIAGPAFEGKLIPVLILDTRNNPRAAEAIRISRFLPMGDVTFSWGRSGKVPVVLSLELIRPAPAHFIIPFDVRKHAALIELIVKSHGVYLQAGVPGDRIKHNIDADKLAVELPDTGFELLWPKLLRKTMVDYFQKLGRSRADSGALTSRFLATLETWSDTRMPPSAPDHDEP